MEHEYTTRRSGWYRSCIWRSRTQGRRMTMWMPLHWIILEADFYFLLL